MPPAVSSAPPKSGLRASRQRQHPASFDFEIAPCANCNACFGALIEKGKDRVERQFISGRESFAVTDFERFRAENPSTASGESFDVFFSGAPFRSAAIIPLETGTGHRSHLILKCLSSGRFDWVETAGIEGAVNTLGLVLASHGAHAALAERLKELTCIYRINQIAWDMQRSVDDILAEMAGVLPPAMQYPEAAEGMVSLDSRVFKTPGFDAKHSVIGQVLWVARGNPRPRGGLLHRKETQTGRGAVSHGGTEPYKRCGGGNRAHHRAQNRAGNSRKSWRSSCATRIALQPSANSRPAWRTN